jgi:3-oxoisoapionate decarboxylase
MKANSRSALSSLSRCTRAPLPRRHFIKTIATATAAGSLSASALRAQSNSSARVPLGIDAHSLRGMRWKAPQLIEYAAGQKVDAVLFNTLTAFESLELAELRRLRETAAARGLEIYFGVGSAAEGSKAFSRAHGSAEELLAFGVRLATALGAPVVNTRIGNLADRSTPGGIKARMEELIKALKAVRTRAQDANVKFAVENHAGDMRSEEVLEVIETAGTDFTGVMLDPGNAVWAMEDPMRQLELLGRHVLCTSVRDWMVWPSPEGATFQWTAIGEGLMDVPSYISQMARLCPGVPLFLETISNSARPIPYLTSEHWTVYPDLRAAAIVDFLKLVRRGRPLEIVAPPPGKDARSFEQEHQYAELERSIAVLRRHGVGRRS